MKRSLTFFAGIFLLITNAFAQPVNETSLCDGIKKIYIAALNSFKEFDKGFNLPDIGKGEIGKSIFIFPMWEKEIDYASRAEAMTKYNDLVAALNNCAPENDHFSYIQDNEEKLKSRGNEVSGSWELPAENKYHAINLDIKVQKIKSNYRLTFSVTNFDLSIADKKDKTVKTNISEDFCVAFNKIIMSGSSFENMKGTFREEGGGIKMYESLVTLPGSNGGYLAIPAISSQYWIADFIKTKDKDAALKKYEEIKTLLGSCKIEVGSFNPNETLIDEDAKKYILKPFILKSAYAINYINLKIQLVFEKTMSGNYDVYIRIAYRP
ncbi:MAG: hypothetical protein ABJA78_03415 [Ferruginibacter sp.]